MITVEASRPLRIAVLVKQVPVVEDLALGPDGRLAREGHAVEMDAFGRRAAALGVALARASGGESVACTMGPPRAADVLRECLAGGVDRAVHLCDEALAGADTLATAAALASLLRIEGPFDLVLAGRAAVDADTGQVPPQVAQLLGLRFAAGAKQVLLLDDVLHLGLEHDDRWLDVEVELPAVVTCAERLCDPLKLKDPALWADVDESRLVVRTAASMGAGPWGAAASPTTVAQVVDVPETRDATVLRGDPAEVAAAAVRLLVDRGALRPAPAPLRAAVPDPAPVPGRSPVVVVAEPGGDDALAERLGAAATLAVGRPSRVVALAAADEVDLERLGGLGADEVRSWTTGAPAAAVAEAIAGWAAAAAPWAVLLGGSDWGREVGARLAARRGARMTGDAVALALDDELRLEARKAAFGGSAEAVIRCRAPLHVATVRPGVLPVLLARRGTTAEQGPPLTTPELGGLRVRSVRQEDRSDLCTARRVVGLGLGVDVADLDAVQPLVDLLGAALGATRKWTDAGWLPHARQIGVTGHAIAPDLYVAIGISGKVTHTAGVRQAATVLAVNTDPDAPIFERADVGIVGDWREVVPALVAELGPVIDRS